MSYARRVRRTETEWRYGIPQIVVVLDAKEAVETGRWMIEEKGDAILGAELVKLGHEAWEEEG